MPVVRFIVAATDRAVRAHLTPKGLLDADLRLLDPACGTGTFLIAAADAVAAQARATWGEGQVRAELAGLAKRLFGFELLVGPYTVAHYRLLRATNPGGGAPAGRMNIYLADTLTPPVGALGVTPHLGFLSAPIVEERRAADRLKRETPILAIFGNPPYRRLDAGEEEAVVHGWDNGFWEDLKAPVRAAGWGGELNTFPDLYVAFWRWCLWKLFESEGATGRGVVSLITNRTFLAGHPYAGLRQMLRRRFDFIDIVDLRGDGRGVPPAGITTDENVFAIQAGICILTAIATGKPRAAGAEAQVRYADIWRHGAFTAAEKLALLGRAADAADGLSFCDIKATALQDFVPVGFRGMNWPSLGEIFEYRCSGIQTKRDSFAYALIPAALAQRLRRFACLANDVAAATFHETRDRKAEVAQRTGWQPEAVIDVIYRPLDRRKLYNRPEFVDFPRPALQSAWGDGNVCLYALPSGTGAGPAVWVHGLLPDYHAFRGSFGGYAFPLWDRRRGAGAHNLAPALLQGLVGAYGAAATPEAVFDAIIALLSAASYTRRFGWDLEEAFAHVPFPADKATFADAVRIGGEIRALEIFAREPAAAFRRARILGHARGDVLAVPPIGRAFTSEGTGPGSIALQEDNSLRLVGVPQAVWDFAVSGYRVLPRWLLARNGEALDADLQRAALDVAWRIEELLHWFTEADGVLARALARPLTCTALGLGVADSAASGVTSQHGLFA